MNIIIFSNMIDNVLSSNGQEWWVQFLDGPNWQSIIFRYPLAVEWFFHASMCGYDWGWFSITRDEQSSKSTWIWSIRTFLPSVNWNNKHNVLNPKSSYWLLNPMASIFDVWILIILFSCGWILSLFIIYGWLNTIWIGLILSLWWWTTILWLVKCPTSTAPTSIPATRRRMVQKVQAVVPSLSKLLGLGVMRMIKNELSDGFTWWNDVKRFTMNDS